MQADPEGALSVSAAGESGMQPVATELSGAGTRSDTAMVVTCNSNNILGR